MPPGDKKKKQTNQQTSSNIQTALSNTALSFFKSDSRKNPYLSSRFNTGNVNVFNPMKNQGPTQTGYTYSVNDGTGTSRRGQNTHYNEAKYRQDQSLKNYFGGPKKYVKGAEKGAKRAASISSNLQKSMYEASKLLAQGREEEADSLAQSAKKTAFYEQSKGGFGASDVARLQNRSITRISDAYFNNRTSQQIRNLTKGVSKLTSTAKITAPDAKEINASLRSLTSRKRN
jgi:hypothetical protein